MWMKFMLKVQAPMIVLAAYLKLLPPPVINTHHLLTQNSTESYQGQEMDQGRDLEVDQWGDPGRVQDSFQNQN